MNDILSYVPDITKPGQRTNLTKIFDTILVKIDRYNLLRIVRKDYCCSWSWPGSAEHWKTLRLSNNAKTTRLISKTLPKMFKLQVTNIS